ncbi:sulfatase [Paraferrimonas sp. SM1919]|uniref:sulfatase family protein n=1 Tax=Paraferrimonas sp. SM1919 TaxID=2662263 RepID=UPI0013D53602|nr:sulfatase [Paraferrimonas sp. SM1919]
MLKITKILAAGVVLANLNNYAISAEQKPNILFIMTDDHAQRAISSYGSELIHTPNIDRLANEGMRFDNAFVSNSICGPSRAAMMTGKHSHINGFIDNKHGRKFDSSQQTFPEILQKAGYETSIFGKWHLGSEPKGFDNWQILLGQGEYYSPQFKSAKGIKTHHGEYVTNLTTDFVLDALKNRDKNKPFAMLYHQKAPHRNWMPDTDLLAAGGMPKEYPLPETFFDDYMGRKAAANQDMQIAGMYLGWDMKLDPSDYEAETTTGGYRLDPTLIDYDKVKKRYLAMYNRMTDEQKAVWNEYYKDLPKQYHAIKHDEKALAIWKFNRYLHDYLATVKSVDDNIGRVLKYLDDNGLADNTIVVYTSDQGFYLGEHGWFDKRFMYEESMSTPLIIRYPALVKGGQVNKRLVQNIDFAPTFIDLAGYQVPEAIQGVSIKPLLSGAIKPQLPQGEKDDWRTGLYYQYFEYPVPHAVMPHYGIRTERYKLIHFQADGGFWEMYDLQNDPSELNNLYGHENYQQLQQQLKQRLQQLRVDYQVPAQDKIVGR